jgi:coenzyme F420 hydrogenase subunit beta
MPFKTFAFTLGRGNETFYMPSGMVMVGSNQTKGERIGKERKMEERKKFSDLKREVIDAGHCTLCGGCVATCRLLDLDYLRMDFSEGRPVLGEGQQHPPTCGSCYAPQGRPVKSGDQQCPIDCGYCYYQCPRVEEPELREGLEEFYEVVSKDDAIRGVCHNGGALISLLASALEDAMVEGCITVADSGDATPEVRIAMNKAALMENAGGTYGYSAALTGIADAILNNGLWSLALVGTPCQMAAYEKMLAVGRGTHNAHDFSSNVRLRISLLCQGAYSYDALLKDFIEGERGIPADTITNFEIQDDGLHVYAGDKELLHAGLDEIADYKREGCKICEDFIGQFADISVGHIGSPAGKSTVIVHTEVGKDAFESARQWDFIEATPMEERGVKLLRLLQEDKKKAGMAEKARKN